MLELDQPVFDIIASDPEEAPCINVSFILAPLKTKKGGICVPIALPPPMTVVVAVREEVIAGADALPLTMYGGACSV